MVSFFVPALKHSQPEEQIWRHTWDLTGSLLVELFPFLLDAASLVGNERVWAAILLPALLGVVYSLKGGAVVLPAYWLFSILIRSIRHSVNGTLPALPSSSSVQAAVFGLVLGYIVPSSRMLISQSPRAIAAWVGFPLTIALAQAFFYPLDGASKILGFGGLLPYFRNLTSYQLVQCAYTLFASLSFLNHLPLVTGVLFPALSGVKLPSSLPSTSSPSSEKSQQTPTTTVLSVAKYFLIPHLSVFHYASREELFARGIQDEVLRFLQWDIIFIALGTWLAGVWSWALPSLSLISSISTSTLAKDVVLMMRVMGASIVGAVLLGPGVVVAGVWMVKEMLDEELRNATLVAADAERVSGAALPWVLEAMPRSAYEVFVGSG